MTPVDLVYISVGVLVAIIVAVGVSDTTKARRRVAALQRAMDRLDREDDDPRATRDDDLLD
jgi:hypothetical protein